MRGQVVNLESFQNFSVYFAADIIYHLNDDRDPTKPPIKPNNFSLNRDEESSMLKKHKGGLSFLFILF